MKDVNKKYPKNYFIEVGIALGIPFGIILAILLDNPGFIGTGLPIGLAVGLAFEKKYKKEGKIRPLTEDEKKKRKIALIRGTGALIIGIIVFLMVLLK